MAHYRMQDRLPSAIVTAGGSEKKVYEGNTIFFNKGDNFELRFFNPLKEKIGIEIIFNGQKKSDGLLVVKPGEDISLDRFLDDKKKMVFDTYHIDTNNPVAVQAAELNGDVIINFYKEKYTSTYHSYNYGTSGTYGTGGSDTIGSCGNSGVSGISGTGGGLPHFTNIGSTNLNSRYYRQPDTFTNESDQSEISFASCDGNVNLDSFDTSNTYNTTNVSNTSSIDYSVDVAENLDRSIIYSEYLGDSTKSKSLTETGRVEKGDVSNQNLNLVNIEFESKPFHSIQYNLKPTSTRGYTTATEIRNYCPGCGYRIRKETWKFCPKCGEKLI